MSSLGLSACSRSWCGERNECSRSKRVSLAAGQQRVDDVGSASVDVSPKPSVAPSAILRRMRRMILPERVLGSAGVKWIFSGAASAPMSWRTSWTSSLRSARRLPRRRSG